MSPRVILLLGLLALAAWMYAGGARTAADSTVEGGDGRGYFDRRHSPPYRSVAGDDDSSRGSISDRLFGRGGR